MAERANAGKDAIDASGVDSVLRGVTDIYSTRGRKVLHLRVEKEKPAREDALALLLGRSGALRAPVVRYRSALIVGFDEATYAQVFG